MFYIDESKNGTSYGGSQSTGFTCVKIHLGLTGKKKPKTRKTLSLGNTEST